ncbi:MAG: phage tail sheath family protein [Thermoflexales bacterium]
MPEYLSPGVYVEEVDRGPKPIEGVGTAMACFVGFTEKASSSQRIDGETIIRDLAGQPVLVTNWSQYVETFGGFVDGARMPMAVYGYFQNGGSRCYCLSVKTIPRAQAVLLNAEGKPALVARAKMAGLDGMKLRVRIEPGVVSGAVHAEKKGKAKDGDAAAPEAAGGQTFNIIVERDRGAAGWTNAETIRDVSIKEFEREDGGKQPMVAYKDNKTSQLVDILLAEGAGGELAKMSPRDQQQTLSLDSRALVPALMTDFKGEVTERTGVEGLEAIDDITMVVTPDLMTTMPGQKLDLTMVKAVQTMIIAHCERMQDRVAILDAPPNMNPQAVKKWRMDTAGYDSSYAALYYPWIEVMDPATNRPVMVPPSGHVAGVWARNDNTRGVHKAPANEVVRGAIGLAYSVTKGEQDTLNPNGVNCIRSFPGMGIRVWGARTLSSNPAWRYINVRRLFNFVEKSIERGTQWVVFEPNDPRLWSSVRRDVTAFLTGVWRDGALFGLAPSEAFFVKCDDETNPSDVRDRGQMIVEIGMAPVKPAEFVIFRISQWGGPGSE